MAQQTAVEWLKKEVEEYGDREYLIIRWTDLDELINQAKQMEKQQIIKAHNDGFLVYGSQYRTGEQYYNGTFGNNTHTHATSTQTHHEHDRGEGQRTYHT